MCTQLNDLLDAVREWVLARRSFDTAYQATAHALLDEPMATGRSADLLDSYVTVLLTARRMAWATRLYSLEDPGAGDCRGVANGLSDAADRACAAVAVIMDGTEHWCQEAVAGSQGVLTMTAVTVKAAAAMQIAHRRMWQSMTPAFSSLTEAPDRQRAFTTAYQAFTSSLEVFRSVALVDSRAFEDTVATLTPFVHRLSHDDVIEDVQAIRAAGQPLSKGVDQFARARCRTDGLLIDAHRAFDSVVDAARRHAKTRSARAAELAHVGETFANALDAARV